MITRCARLLMRRSTQVIEAEPVDMTCPECGSEVARITYMIISHLFGSRRTRIEAVPTVLACADDEMCGWYEEVEVPA